MLRIDNGTLETRTHAIEETLRAPKLDGLVLYANGSALGNKSRMHGYLRYLCNYDGRNTPAVLIVRPGKEPFLLTGNPNAGFNRTDTADKSLWFESVRHVQAHLLGEEVASVLKADGDARRIAYLGYNETPAPVWKSLEKNLPNVEWVYDFAAHFDKHRVQKNALELTLHRRAAEICDAMFRTLAHEVKSGKTGYQLQAAMEHTARCEGCDYILTWLTVSPAGDFPRFEIDECQRVPQTGDQVLAGLYITYDGHWGHAIRTANIGAPSETHRRIYDQVREMLEAALEKLRPGENLYDVNAAMTAVIRKNYAPTEVRTSRAGHGLGYSYEDPIVSLAFPYAWNVKPQAAGEAPRLEVKPGMLLELHPQIWVPEVGGAMIGEMVAVTETGYEMLNKFPNQLIVW